MAKAPAIVDDLDSVAEPIREFYAEQDGVFVLQIDSFGKHPGAKALKTSLDRLGKDKDTLAAERDALKARIEGLPEDLDAEAYAALKAQAEGKGGGATEEQLQAARDKVREKLEKQYKGEIAARDEGLTKLKGTLHRMTVDDGLSRAMDQAQIDARHKAKLLPYLKSAAKIAVDEGDDGFRATVDTDMGPVSLADYVREWAASDDGKIYVAKPTGPSPKGGQGAAGGKTIRRADFDALDPKTQAATVREGTRVVD